MRPLKFRVYEKPLFIYFELGSMAFPERYLYQDKYPVQQFTGMCDIFGKEIYEGDIVQYNNKSSWDGVDLEVSWNEDSLAWEFYSKKQGLLEQSRLMKYKKEGKRFYDRVEVVGNIFESKYE